MKRLFCFCVGVAWFWSGVGPVAATQPAPPTGLVLNLPGSFEGYTLFAPSTSRYTYLIDNDGQLINRWQSGETPGFAAYLLENGHLFRTARTGISFGAGGAGGRIEEFDWDGTLLWQFDYASAQVQQHHDALKLPNGNVLILAWERKSEAEAEAAGRIPSTVAAMGLWPEHLVEVRPEGATGGTIVWEWHVWDHLIQDYDAAKGNYGVVGDHPELVDMNFNATTSPDMLHCNGLSYNPGLRQILIGVHRFHEIWVIDHTTTTAEAAGHAGGERGRGGDILYRWGNPQAYRRGTELDQQLWSQHNPNWIPDGHPGGGNIIIFNNGRLRPGGSRSTIDEIVVPVDALGNYALAPGGAYEPAAPLWTYDGPAGEQFYASFISGVQRLPNGNTLICQGPRGRYFEVTADREMVWDYLNPVDTTGPVLENKVNARGETFRAERYAVDYPGFAGRDLTPKGPVEFPVVYLFALTDIDRTGEGIVLRWASYPDVTYTIEFQEGSGGGWVGVAEVEAIGTLTAHVDRDPGRLGAAHGFYRVAQLE